jgi:hypothetical protein
MTKDILLALSAGIHDATKMAAAPKAAQQLCCSGCGATVDAACACGLPYQPKIERAAKAIDANPNMSDRAIAKEIGVGNKTVSRARNAGVSHDTAAVQNNPAKRIGRDGRKHPATQKPRVVPADAAEDLATRDLINRASEAYTLADWNVDGAKLDQNVIDAVQDAANAWSDLLKRVLAAHSNAIGLAVTITPSALSH